MIHRFGEHAVPEVETRACREVVAQLLAEPTDLTVIFVARVRPDHAGTGYFDTAMQARIRAVAEATAERLSAEGLNPVDQFVGSFGPAMAVFSAHDQVRTDTSETVGVGAAIDIAADAVAGWRIRRLAQGGLQGVEGEAQFALPCWATLGAAEFRFGDGSLRLVTHPSAITASPEAACVDGLDPRQHAMWWQLRQPGERLPLLLVSAEAGAFRVTLCAWLSGEGMREVRSFADLRALVASWDGREAPTGAWQAARAKLRLAAQSRAAGMADRSATAAASKAEAQNKAARLRLIDELGRLLICFEPDTESPSANIFMPDKASAS